MNENGEQKRFKQMSNDAAILKARLLDVKQGELVTYEDLGTAIGRSVKSQDRDAYAALQTARKSMSRDEGIEFVSVTGVGLKRADPSEQLDRMQSYMRRARRANRTGIKVSRNVEYGRLDPEQRAQYTHASLIASITELAHRPSTKKKIGMDDAVNVNGIQTIPVASFVKLFKKREE